MTTKIEEEKEIVFVITGEERVGMSSCGIWINDFLKKEMKKNEQN